MREEHREALKATVGRMLDSTLAPTAVVDAERTPAHKSNPTSRVRKIAKPKPQSAGATDRAKDVGRSPTDTADTSPLGIANGHDSAENNYGCVCKTGEPTLSSCALASSNLNVPSHAIIRGLQGLAARASGRRGRFTEARLLQPTPFVLYEKTLVRLAHSCGVQYVRVQLFRTARDIYLP